MMIQLRRTVAASTVIALVALGACSDDDASSDTDAPAAETTAAPEQSVDIPATDGLVISGLTFGSFTATAAQPFTIVNEDGAPHTVTADDGSFTASVDPNGTAELTVATAGSYPIHCEIHSTMAGTLTVQA